MHRWPVEACFYLKPDKLTPRDIFDTYYTQSVISIASFCLRHYLRWSFLWRQKTRASGMEFNCVFICIHFGNNITLRIIWRISKIHTSGPDAGQRHVGLYDALYATRHKCRLQQIARGNCDFCNTDMRLLNTVHLYRLCERCHPRMGRHFTRPTVIIVTVWLHLGQWKHLYSSPVNKSNVGIMFFTKTSRQRQCKSLTHA